MHVQHKRRQSIHTRASHRDIAALLYCIRSWRRKGYDKKRRYKDRLQDLDEQRRFKVGEQVRTQQAVGKKGRRSKTRLTQCYWESCQGTELH